MHRELLLTARFCRFVGVQEKAETDGEMDIGMQRSIAFSWTSTGAGALGKGSEP